MTPAALRAAREQIGLDPDRMAAQIGVTPHVYAAFEAGALGIPRKHAQIAAHFAGAAAQEAALAASGLPECEWWKEWTGSVPPWGSPRLKPHLARGREHFRGCATCQGRAAYVDQHCPPIPEFPVPWTFRAIGRVARWFGDRLRPLRRREQS